MIERKPNVAIIGLKGLPAFGGAARATEELVKRLKSYYDFTIYTVDTHGSAKFPYPEIQQILLKGYKSKRLNTLLYYIKACLHSIFKSNYDLVHLQHLYSGFLAPFLKIKYDVVSTVRGIVPPKDNKWNKIDKMFFRWFERISLAFSDEIVSVAKPHIAYLNNISKKNIRYVPNGIDIEESKNYHSVSKNDNLLFAAARIISLKGCHLLLEALKMMEYKNPVHIIGNLNHVPNYSKYLRELSIGLNIKFLGLIKDKGTLLNHLSSSKLFIFPSFNEGMSNMLLEVASVKTPIIASNIEENKAVFTSEEVLFFKVGETQDLAEKINWALNNYDEMLDKSMKAYNKLRQEYNWDTIAKTYSDLYTQMLNT